MRDQKLPDNAVSKGEISELESPGESAAAACDEILATSRRRTRRAFLVGGAAAAAGYGFYHWLDYGPHRNMLPSLVDRAYDANAAVARGVFREHSLAPTYPLSRAETLRVNGMIGLKKNLHLDTWRLQLVGAKDAAQRPRYSKDVTAWEYGYGAESPEDDGGGGTKKDTGAQSPAPAHASPEAGKNGGGKNDAAAKNGNAAKDSNDDENGSDHKNDQKQPDGQRSSDTAQDDNQTGRKPRGLDEAGESDSTLPAGTPGLLLTLKDFLPHLKRYELVTQFKCIEGWSQIVHWAGVRFADFLEMFPPALVGGKEPRYVYMESPDGDYYVGYDMEVCRHPQTLLVTEMMGTPLTQQHGAPLRLHTPTKYGYKQIKRIGLIAYTNDKPDDYWTKLGYDWYAGL